MKLELVQGWKSLWRAWSVWAAAIGLVLPEVLELLAEHVDSLPMLDDGHKSLIRVGCLIAVVVLRPIRQRSLS